MMLIEIAKEFYNVKYVEDASVITNEMDYDRPSYITFDSETTGLHLKKDRPFLWAVSWNNKVFVFPSSKRNLLCFKDWKPLTNRMYAHNTVFDLNMLANGLEDDALPASLKVGDTMGLCRLVFEAISSREGGDSLALKAIADKYIDKTASRFEKDVKKWLTEKKKADRKILLAMLKGQYGWTAKRFEDALNKGSEPIPDDVMQMFKDWRTEYPDPTYQDVPMGIMLPYVASDVILTNMLVRKSLPVVAAKQQEAVMEEEFDLIPVVFKMSRIGIKVDQDYLMESHERLSEYISELEQQMFDLSGGKQFTVGQHQVIKELYTELLGEAPASVDKKFMAKQAEAGDQLAVVISKLRTLDKWRSTYIERILEGSNHDGRFYATLDQFNPVSGRFSGNLQQQPKKGILRDGVEIFHPRKAFLADSEEGYDIFLLDFSQVELRFQAHYTLPFGGDTNLCRAYMPYKCFHIETGEEFDYKTEEGRARWNEKLPNGLSAWYIPEDAGPIPWKPTDVHSASTRKALTLMKIDPDSLSEKEFETWRGLGKGVNFAKNYGVGIKGAAEQFGLDVHVAKALCEGYNEAFPTVLQYQVNVTKALGKRGFVSGVYGRRYYLSDSWRFYKAANYLIQGSCAHDLKQKMLLLDSLLAGKKSAMLTCIHDEIVFRIHRTERHMVPQIKAIMEYTPKVHVPIISEVDYTETNWAAKEKYKEPIPVC
jgi:DNA polymerase-1